MEGEECAFAMFRYQPYHCSFAPTSYQYWGKFVSDVYTRLSPLPAPGFSLVCALLLDAARKVMLNERDSCSNNWFFLNNSQKVSYEYRISVELHRKKKKKRWNPRRNQAHTVQSCSITACKEMLSDQWNWYSSYWDECIIYRLNNLYLIISCNRIKIHINWSTTCRPIPLIQQHFTSSSLRVRICGWARWICTEKEILENPAIEFSSVPFFQYI